MNQIIPVYIPSRKITILSPKPLQRLAFILNYKGLITSKLEIQDDMAVIQFVAFEPFRRSLASWQLAKTPADETMWNWINKHAVIELVLDKVDPSEAAIRTNQPYLPRVRVPMTQIAAFYSAFHAAKF